MGAFKNVVRGLGLVSAALLSACAVPAGSEEEMSATGEGLATSAAHKVLNEWGINQGWNSDDTRLFGDIDGDGDQDIVGIDESGIHFSRYQPGTPLFSPTLSASTLVQNHLTTDYYGPFLLGRLDSDAAQDILAFASDGVHVIYSGAAANYQADQVKVTGWFGTDWSHQHLLGDMNGDGYDDLVGFAGDGVWVTYWVPGAHLLPRPVHLAADFGYDQGWRVDKHLRYLADVNGDGRKDIVGFKNDGVWLSLATASGLSVPTRVLASFQNWQKDAHPRVMGDVNGDGMSDIIGFGSTATYVALSTGTGFAPPTRWSLFFDVDSGFTTNTHMPRFVADRNGDGRADIVGFGPDGMYVATSTGTTFNAPQNVSPNLGTNNGWNYGPTPIPFSMASVVDFKRNGYANAVVFGEDGTWTDWPSVDLGNLPVFQPANP